MTTETDPFDAIDADIEWLNDRIWATMDRLARVEGALRAIQARYALPQVDLFEPPTDLRPSKRPKKKKKAPPAKKAGRR